MTSLQSALPRHLHPLPPLKIAMIGTRGMPAGDGGIETAVEEVGRRLVVHGHQVTVYGRPAGGAGITEHLGMRCVTLPALRRGAGGSRTHTALAALHLLAGPRTDVAFLFDPAGAPLVPLIRARGTAVAVHLRGPEREALHSSRTAEGRAVREADALIADARAVQDAAADDFAVPAELIGYGTTIVRNCPTDLLEGLGLVPGHFLLAALPPGSGGGAGVLAEGYHRATTGLPLVVVGAGAAAEGVAPLDARDPRIRLLGAISDQRLLDQLHSHAAASLHGPSAGGAHAALLRAMGSGTAVIASDTVVNREVAGTGGCFFSTPSQLARQIEDVERYPFRFTDLGELMQERARRRFDWDVVAERYEALAARLARGYSTRGMSTGRRVDWSTLPASSSEPARP